jgi:hypothetical protein
MGGKDLPLWRMEQRKSGLALGRDGSEMADGITAARRDSNDQNGQETCDGRSLAVEFQPAAKANKHIDFLRTGSSHD